MKSEMKSDLEAASIIALQRVCDQLDEKDKEIKILKLKLNQCNKELCEIAEAIEDPRVHNTITITEWIKEQNMCTPGDEIDGRSCTCPPMERPYSCARKFALSECKAATIMNPVIYRWRHKEDEVWKYGKLPTHLIPLSKEDLDKYYIIQPLFSVDTMNFLLSNLKGSV